MTPLQQLELAELRELVRDFKASSATDTSKIVDLAIARIIKILESL